MMDVPCAVRRVPWSVYVGLLGSGSVWSFLELWLDGTRCLALGTIGVTAWIVDGLGFDFAAREGPLYQYCDLGNKY
jgi:hypothetical protein